MNMDLVDFMRSFADEIGGHFSEYNKTQNVIIVPQGGNRYQAVVGVIKEDSKFYNKLGMEFTSTVCAFREDIDFAEMLRENAKYSYSKFVISDDFIKVEACIFLNQITSKLLKEVILEVASMADKWEFKTTGLDVH